MKYEIDEKQLGEFAGKLLGILHLYDAPLFLEPDQVNTILKACLDEMEGKKIDPGLTLRISPDSESLQLFRDVLANCVEKNPNCKIILNRNENCDFYVAITKDRSKIYIDSIPLKSKEGGL